MKLKKLICAVLFLMLVLSLGAQQIDEMEFRNKPIKDILFALAEITGTSIVPDDTVEGNASYFFKNTNLNTALETFLSRYDLYHWQENNIIYVSKIRIQKNPDGETISVDVNDAQLPQLINALSKGLGFTILNDQLPNQQITIHNSRTTVKETLDIIIARYPDYTIEETTSYFYIKKNLPQLQSEQNQQARSEQRIAKNGELYSINQKAVRFKELIGELFNLEGKEFISFITNDVIIENLYLQNKTFEEMLKVTLEQANGDYQIEHDIFYLFPISRQDVIKNFTSTEYLQFSHISSQEFLNLLPPALSSNRFFKIDTTSNGIILSGTPMETKAIKEFLLQVDVPVSGRSFERVTLNHIDVQNIIGLLPQRYSNLKPVIIPNTNSFVIQLSLEQREEFLAYIDQLDATPELFPIKLKYIQAQSLLEHLPPGIDKEDIFETTDPSLIFFQGSIEKLGRFKKGLEELDKPVPQIRYELLVIQYQKNKNFNWQTKYSITGSTDESGFSGTGQFGQLIDLSFDVVSIFGAQYAAKLNTSLSSNSAEVQADTTLNGLSGEQLKFQNTDTYRYRDTEVDPDTGKTTTRGVIREITSGLTLSVNGWTSGDGIVTMEVSAEVSKRGTSTDKSVSIPPTSEKVIQTHIRTPSGKPVIIGGLMQQEKNITIAKTPILGDIPLLGLLFQSEVETYQNTELVIYIVPYVEYGIEQYTVSEELELERLFNKYIVKE